MSRGGRLDRKSVTRPFIVQRRFLKAIAVRDRRTEENLVRIIS